MIRSSNRSNRKMWMSLINMGGTGLGLSIVKRFTQLMGGGIHVTSMQGVAVHSRLICLRQNKGVG